MPKGQNKFLHNQPHPKLQKVLPSGFIDLVKEVKLCCTPGHRKFSQGSIEVRKNVEWICAVNVGSFQHMNNVQLSLN